MKTVNLNLCFFIAGLTACGLLLANSSKESVDFPTLRGPYMGQEPPGTTPEMFAPGIVSHGFHEHGLTLSPDGEELFFVTSDSHYSQYVIVRVERVDDVWKAPEVAPFSGQFKDGGPAFSHDGKTLYFSSNRPIGEGSKAGADLNIWTVTKEGDSWSEPRPLGLPVNTDKQEGLPSVAANGNIYFQRADKLGLKFDIYVARKTEEGYAEPESLGTAINTERNEAGPCVAPDESFLLFQSNRMENPNIMSLYVSFRQKDQTWGEPVLLGKEFIGTFGPSLSPDGKVLFFTSWRGLDPDIYRGKSYSELLTLYRDPRNGKGTLFWVGASVIEMARSRQ